ncbi:MAG: sulfide/dihydroorotate dehydrogenase-like FAD/NAD-binding protein [Candidatus Bathyarchaeia archaeon]|nr:sulfide/dihydroorotate dehydrogenase-like FAD/NAD-binding protein [Candidatus Bathyarchaeota archaeon]
MYEILAVKELAPKIKWFEVYAPHIAKKAKPGQFIILIINERGERIPLTIAGYDREKGIVSFAFNEVGKTTKQLGLLKEGDRIWNIAGPLGNPSEIRKFGKVLCVAAGVMIAPMLLQIKALREAGNEITAVIGARRRDLLFFVEDIKALSHRFYVATDDGSEGHKGLGFLKEIVAKEKFDRCIVMGPVPTLQAVSEITRPYGIPTIVSLMPLMVDGMGMCGVCRVLVGGKMKFACVDGPEFDGHLVDYEELIRRQRMFIVEERLSALLWEMGGLKYG